MKCIIIEDQPPAQRILKKYIGDLGTLELAAVFSNAIEAMDYLRRHAVDVMFLDIHLPKISGIDFLKSLPHPPHVILTTAFPDYALESYDLNVVDYLLKPFSFQRFIKAVAKIPGKQPQSSGEDTDTDPVPVHLFIKSGYEHIKILIADILYIKSDADYTELFLINGKKHLSSEPLRHWSATLDAQVFMRIHKSYVVNTVKITKVAGNYVYLTDDERLPIGRAFKDDFVKRFLP